MNPVEPSNGFAYFGDGPAKTKPKSELDMSTFLRLMVTQLANQNPLEPMKDADFYAQLAQLGQVQGIDKLQKSMDTMQSAGLIGKTVTAVRPMTDGSDGFNSLVTGEVVKVTIRDGNRILGVREADGGIVDIRIENVREVRS